MTGPSYITTTNPPTVDFKLGVLAVIASLASEVLILIATLDGKFPNAHRPSSHRGLLHTLVHVVLLLIVRLILKMIKLIIEL